MSERSFYLDFERPIVELEKSIEEMQTQAQADGLDLSRELRSLEERAERLRHDIYSGLTRWQRVQISRHPQRPYALDYISKMLTDFTELHGDRYFGDDKAIVGGPARLDGEPLIVVGIQSGRNVEDRKMRNFGMPHPEGYRKALRLMQMAAKFGKPVLTLVDTSGAFPGIEAEERGQAEAIARNLFEMSHLPVPIVVAVIGQAFSGGAIGITVGDRILMLEHAVYSVIVPESCSTILFRTRDRKEEAAEALKLSAADLKEHGIIDRVVPEPFGGAHRDMDGAATTLKRHIKEAYAELRGLSPTDLVDQRVEKFASMGHWEE
ncbi:MAG: acetyl-CoA carboxylase carboxyltransferase subunit alpha [Gemmatimonadetes bacterium]|jgi:acetyl-CoA carboxylase carboxyl transferase subunit alpha|nr:acetyl-CoA carboxylase carboxyltransferase subunit alpha [Gemmatimonadota bacterium]MBT5058037.1 acetyl-CoA carboxylase carboxyltransferase subunit alpha [Gemmatimonadota bacterium]MBT5141697.1 acetyl-CoA carboxylase carboxyltransferase subunit alpha [Gemmatimonadota bacterium]MBT5591000.1 acetyl-CoA carboxylase carboxyltransferase subunit alpha [Gemmatimonadota bacterium]MBT5964934.1 acetyl-CoA carboxylase carboxyltransferase subunit alpha [Gemmatimonadota bacterium]